MENFVSNLEKNYFFVLFCFDLFFETEFLYVAPVVQEFAL